MSRRKTKVTKLEEIASPDLIYKATMKSEMEMRERQSILANTPYVCCRIATQLNFLHLRTLQDTQKI
jgi:hypothetical protein